MIAIRVTAAGRELAGLGGWENDEEASIVPVVPARPAGYTRADAERDGYIVGGTDADRELAVLRRVRRSCRRMSEEHWREFLRLSEDYSAWAELPEWSEPPAAGPADGVPYDVAEALVADGFAEWLELDLDGVEAELDRWLGGSSTTT